MTRKALSARHLNAPLLLVPLRKIRISRRCWNYAAVIVFLIYWVSYNAHYTMNVLSRVDVSATFRDRVDPGILFINMPEHSARLLHLSRLVRDIGYFHAVRFESACPECDKDRGVLFSHLRLLKRIAEEAHDRYVIVLEDDVEIADQVSRENFVSVLDYEVQHVLQPERDGFVYLGVCLDDEHAAVCKPRSCAAFCTHAYMVTPRGSRKILRDLQEKYGEYDLDKSNGRSILFYGVVEPPPVLGWSYTHDHTVVGWRGLFYQARKSPWHVATTINKPPSLQIIVAHEPRNDLLGAFVTPSLLLFAVASYHGWEMEILPFAGSEQEEILNHHFAIGDKIDKSWGSGFRDASNRENYNPAKLNTESAETMGFFPAIPETSSKKNWIKVENIPRPGVELEDICRSHDKSGQNDNACYILLPDNPYLSEQHMEKLGGYDRFFSSEFREQLRTKFLKKNEDRLKHYNDGGYNIAVHVRRGDILDPGRWIDQPVYAKVIRRICKSHPEAKVHVFSSGKNRDGNWTTLERLTTEEAGADGARCASVSFHLDELEFDTWTHMVAADAFIMSKSSFSLIPALLCGGEVYYPHNFWHLRLSSFHVFHSDTGDPQP